MQMFVPRRTRPESGNPYYNTPIAGGYAVGAILGKPTDAGCNVLANCVGYAAARFNEIIGADCWKYLQCPPNPDQWITRAKQEGLQVGKEPKLGAILVWGHHVAIVEQINEDGTIVTSESGYGCSNPFWITTRNNDDGCWNGPKYNGFQGFIYQPEVITMNGIDVSRHNGKIDWQKVKDSGVQFAILRAGYGKIASQKDDRFEENYAGAKAAGLPVGAYWYSYAKTVDEAKQEAAACIEVLKGKRFEFPIWFDQEEKDQFATGKANCSAMIRAFCNALEAAGYWVGLYTSRSILGTHIEDDIKSRYALWVAEWGSKLNYSSAVGMWQRSSKGSIPGISGDVDLDISYVDYPTKIKAKGLNGFEKTGKLEDIMVEIGSNPPDDMPDSVRVSIDIDGAKYSGTLVRTD